MEQAYGAMDRESNGGRTIWAGELPSYMDEEQLQEALRKLRVSGVKVFRGRLQAKGESYAFLEFDSRNAAAQFLQTYQGLQIPGTHCVWNLNWSHGNRSRGFADGELYSVYVGNLAASVDDDQLFGAFQQYFPSVRSVKIMRDGMTNVSRGFGFVRFSDPNDHAKALQSMQGFQIASLPIRVSEASSKRFSSSPSERSFQGYREEGNMDPNNTTLFIGGVSPTVTEGILQQIFGSFGEIVYVKIPQGRNCGFVQMAHRPSAESAMSQLQGHVIGGQAIRIAWGKNHNAQVVNPAKAQYAEPQSNYQSYPGYGFDSSIETMNRLMFAQGFAAAQQFFGYQGFSQGYGDQYGQANGNAKRHPRGDYHSSLQRFAEMSMQDSANDVDKANANYVMRHQTSLLGPTYQRLGERNHQ